MKRLFALVCILALLAGCTPAPAEDTFTITATTYPVYLFALAVTENIPNVKVERLDTGSVSCLHDYTLSVNDMKKIERADVLALSGAGLEDFMSDALAATDAAVIDCSKDAELLPTPDYSGYDPHYWLDPILARTMVDNLYKGISNLLPEQDGPLFANAQKAHEQLLAAFETMYSSLDHAAQTGVAFPGMISFHDGFRYLAASCGMPVLRSIEEEAGSEAAARDLDEVIRLIREENVPVIFTETNGSDASAQAIARETGCKVVPLSMLMDGREPTAEDAGPADVYAEALLANVFAIIDGFSQTGGEYPA